MSAPKQSWYVRDFRASTMATLGWVGPSIDSILIVDKAGDEIVESAGDNCVVARIQFDNRTEPLGDNNMADARLISAAPDLLEALSRTVDELESLELASRNLFPMSCTQTRKNLRSYRAAIAKATGESAQ